MIKWPKQSECDAFYGNPRGSGGGHVDAEWQREHITLLDNIPFAMHMGAIKITKIAVHVKCHDVLSAWLHKVWDNSGHDQSVISRWGMDTFSGSFNYRPMRGIQQLSMHAYGCAFDFDAPRNPLGSHHGNFSHDPQYTYVVRPFIDLGGTWGGSWRSRPDCMHFQFATVD